MPYHPQQLPKPCNAGFYYFCKRKKKGINRDSSCVILSKISTLSTSVIISWKAKRRRGGGGRRKREEVARKLRNGNLLGVFTLLLLKNIWSATGLLSLVLRNCGDASRSRWNLNIRNWKRNLPHLPAVKFPVLKADLGARSKTQPRPCNAECCRAWLLGALPCGAGVGGSGAAGWEPALPGAS